MNEVAGQATTNRRAFASAFKPTIWHRLGFRRHFDEALFDWRNDPMEGFAEGAVTTNINVHVSFMDRLRILFSGHVEIAAYTKTNVNVDRAVTRSEFAVLPPIPRAQRPRSNC